LFKKEIQSDIANVVCELFLDSRFNIYKHNVPASCPCNSNPSIRHKFPVETSGPSLGIFISIKSQFRTVSLNFGSILIPRKLKSAGYHRVGIQVLSQAISHGAMHNSAERDPPPRCHPGTRERATEDIVRWIEESNPASAVLWVNGRAGVGKSALMQRIAELGLVYFGGCFFFRRGAPGCNVKDYLFSTLAYQLAMKVPGMLEHVDQAMIQDLSLPKRSAAVQLKTLIIDLIRLLPIPLVPLRPTVIIIDGLDECEDFNSQRDILTLIGQVTMDPDIAIQFITSSRPEHQICGMFNKEPLFSRTRRLVLDEGYDTAADIERYLRDEIYSCNKDIIPNVKSPWPLERDLEMLGWRASGQFIYAATVI
jgi:hypothetical protein